MNSREKEARCKALYVLGFAGDAAPDADEIASAFRAACKANHPDTTAQAMENYSLGVSAGLDMNKPAETWTMDSIKTSRDILVRQLDAGEDNACVQCKGRGIVRATMGSRHCGACNGTGIQHGR